MFPSFIDYGFKESEFFFKSRLTTCLFQLDFLPLLFLIDWSLELVAWPLADRSGVPSTSTSLLLIIKSNMRIFKDKLMVICKSSLYLRAEISRICEFFWNHFLCLSTTNSLVTLKHSLAPELFSTSLFKLDSKCLCEENLIFELFN